LIRQGASPTRGLSPARKSRSDTGFALLSFGEEPCPLSPPHGWLNTQPDHLQAYLKVLNPEKNDAYVEGRRISKTVM